MPQLLLSVHYAFLMLLIESLYHRLSKTYSSFRSLSSQLKKSAEKSCSKLNGSIPPDLARAIKFAESVNHVVDSQKTEYLGKVCILPSYFSHVATALFTALLSFLGEL